MCKEPIQYRLLGRADVNDACLQTRYVNTQCDIALTAVVHSSSAHTHTFVNQFDSKKSATATSFLCHSQAQRSSSPPFINLKSEYNEVLCGYCCNLAATSASKGLAFAQF